jgi:hypothetical protein
MSKKVYDLTRIRKTYPLRRKRPVYAVIDDSSIENVNIEITDNSQLPFTYTFENQYTTLPVCIATVQNKQTNINITSKTITDVTLDISGRLDTGESIIINLQIFKDYSQ